MEELNKKLLAFAGFDWLNNWGVWRYPDETHESNLSAKVPNFPEDISACFKWLVPKLHAFMIAGGMCAGNGVTVWLKPGGKFAKVADKPIALALCLAIEKLIDGEKDV